MKHLPCLCCCPMTQYCFAMIQGPDAGEPNCVFPDEYGDTNDGYSACLVSFQLHAQTAQDDGSLYHRTGCRPGVLHSVCLHAMLDGQKDQG